MALILNIETSAGICSVCLAENGNILREIRATETNSHTKILTLQIEQLFREANKTLQDVDAIALSSGPGSYTGLRIGASVAKGLCFALNKPLIAISTLQSLAAQMKNSTKTMLVNAEKTSENAVFFLPIIEARKGAFYCALYDEKLAEIEIQTYCKDMHAVPFTIEEKKTFTNFPYEKTQMPVFSHIFGVKVAEISPNASNMLTLSFDKFQNRAFENVTLYEPNYITGFGNNL